MNNNGNNGPDVPSTPESGEAPEPGNAAETASGGVEPDLSDLEKAADAILEADEGSSPDDEIEKLKAELAEANDRYIRAHAEMDNLRKRTERELINRSKFAISKFAESVLSVGDNIQRAMQSVTEEALRDNPALQNLVDGIKVTERELLNILERHDIKRIEAEGHQLDPNRHQAMFEIPDETVPSGTVLQVIAPGYMIGDRLLRAAQVGVSKGGPKAAPVAAASAVSDVPVDAPIEPLDDDPGIGVDPAPEPSSQTEPQTEQQAGTEPSAASEAANDDAPPAQPSSEPSAEPRDSTTPANDPGEPPASGGNPA